MPVLEIRAELIYFVLSRRKFPNGVTLDLAPRLVDLELEKGQELVRKECSTRILFQTNAQQKIMCFMKRRQKNAPMENVQETVSSVVGEIGEHARPAVLNKKIFKDKKQEQGQSWPKQQEMVPVMQLRTQSYARCQYVQRMEIGLLGKRVVPAILLRIVVQGNRTKKEHVKEEKEPESYVEQPLAMNLSMKKDLLSAMLDLVLLTVNLVAGVYLVAGHLVVVVIQ